MAHDVGSNNDHLLRVPQVPNASLYWQIILTVAPVLAFLVQLPTTASFNFFAFGDMGSTTKAVLLVNQSLRPTVDFGYPYGLLTLSMGRAWNAIFGPSVFSFIGLMVILHVVIGYGIARISKFCKLSCIGNLILLLMAFWISQQWGVVYALEGAVILHLVAEVARNRLETALALATVGVFVKPSMAYVLGFILITYEVAGFIRTRNMARIRNLRLASVIGPVFAVTFGVAYGIKPLLGTLLPIGGVGLYRQRHSGLFGDGIVAILRGKHLGYYFGTEAGFYLFGIATLMASACIMTVSIWRKDRVQRAPTPHFVVFVCTFSLVCCLIGFYTYWNYIYLVAVGAAICISPHAEILPRKLIPVWQTILIGLAMTSYSSIIRPAIQDWRDTWPFKSTYYCWTSRQEMTEWQRCLDATSAGPRLILTGSGAADALVPTEQNLPVVYGIRGLVTRGELLSSAVSIGKVKFLIIPRKALYPMLNWPEFAAEINDFGVILDTTNFLVLARK